MNKKIEILYLCATSPSLLFFQPHVEDFIRQVHPGDFEIVNHLKAVEGANYDYIVDTFCATHNEDQLLELRKLLKSEGGLLIFTEPKKPLEIINRDGRKVSFPATVKLYMRRRGFFTAAALKFTKELELMCFRKYTPTKEERVEMLANSLFLPSDFFKKCGVALDNPALLLDSLQTFLAGQPYARFEMDMVSPNEFALFAKTQQVHQKTIETLRQMGGVLEDGVIFFPKTLKRKFQAFLMGCEPSAIQSITLRH